MTALDEAVERARVLGSLKAAGFLLLGAVVGYGLGVRSASPGARPEGTSDPTAYRLPARYGTLGPKLLASGAIDVERLAAALGSQGAPLTDGQRRILLEGSDEPIEFRGANAPFLLDLFWALGLTNQNPILTRGPMTAVGIARVGGFASTGGWRLGARPATELYASTPLVPLTIEQQIRLGRVAEAVYRPCCDNSAAFPDCNHGMAMLGMLTLLAAEGADEDAMFAAAAAANAAWYPSQYREVGAYVAAFDPQAVNQVDPRRLVGPVLASASGFRQARGRLAQEGLLPEAPGGGGTAAC